MAPRILIFGTGSIGAVYTYLLSRVIPASNIVTVCRSNYQAACQNGFTINSGLWGTDLIVKPIVVRSVTEAVASDPGTPFDYIVICSKVLPSNPSPAEQIRPAVTESTTIVLIQNGISIEEPYSTLYPSNPLLSTVVYLPATQTSPAVIAHKEVERLHVGTYPSSAPESHQFSAQRFVDLLTSANATAIYHSDIQFERWSKLLVNASWNPICALSRCTDANFFLSSPGAHDYVRDVMLEIASIAQAYGYDSINTELVDLQIGRAAVREPPGVEPSMMADALAGRSMEVEALVGNVVRLAADKKVKVPLLRSVYFLVKALNASFEMGK